MDSVICCSICTKAYTRRNRLIHHMRTAHDTSNVKPRGQLRCTSCSEEEFSTKSTLMKHLEERHGLTTSVTTHVFNDYKDFYSWKDELEKETLTSYAQVRRNIRNGLKRTYFDCHRSGTHRRRGEKRKLKFKGSNRMGGNCPAGIRVDEDIASGNLTVYLTSPHFGHENEVDRLRLDKEVKQDLAEKLQQGISKSTLLSSIREHFSPNQRIGITSNQDLLNICKAFKVTAKDKSNAECSNEIETQQHAECDEIVGEVIVEDAEGEMRDLVLKEIGQIGDYANKCVDFESLHELRQLLAPARDYLDTKCSSLDHSLSSEVIEESSELCEDILDATQASKPNPINVIVKYNEDIVSVQALLTSSTNE
ncbi:hypothetical protein CHUAL_014229 [Chamberlinius hualienensis]